MATATAMARPYAVPSSGGSGRAIALAVVMHVLLAALLFFGVRWQSSPPAVIQAELWSATPQVAAAAPRPAVVQPAPQPVAATSSVRVEPEPPQPKADIVEAKAKVEPPKKKKKVPTVVRPPVVQPQVVKPPVEPKPIQKVKPPPTKVVPKIPPKPNPELLKLQREAAVEAPARPPSELAALLSSASKESTGKDQQTSGPRGDQNGYTAKLQAAIRSQMRYPATAADNPYVDVRIEQLPNGEVLNVTVMKRSGVQAFDDAVERAIRAASPLPRPTQGQPPRELEVRYNMYDKG